jgi:biopolymer transport protein ExbD
MLVSLSMVNLKGIKVNLPAASSAVTDTKKDFVDISVDKSGAAFLDKKPIGNNELVRNLTALKQANPNLRVIISGDEDARHGDVIRVLDFVRAAGIDKVAFEIRQLEKAGKP